MTCKADHNINFEIKNENGITILKIRPRSMQFDRTRGKFDICQAEFSENVADEIRPALNNELSFLQNPLPVIVLIDGDPIYRLIWVPSGTTFGKDNVHLEFHDAQKYLTLGTIDWRKTSVSLRDAYNHIFNNRRKDGANIFNEIKFADTEEDYSELIAAHSADFIEFTQNDPRFYPKPYSSKEIEKIERENVYNVIEGDYAIDFDKITPWECITRLNKKFGLNSWAAPDGNLWVGTRPTYGSEHISAPDDRRVWKLTDYNVTSSRTPVVKSVIRGGWVEDPSESITKRAKENVTHNGRTEDFRIEGVALKGSTSPFAGEIFEEIPEAEKSSLESIAKRKMINKMREQQTGYIEINPEVSGSQQTDIRYASVGDTIWTIPSDGNSNCSSNIEEEKYNITGVQHELNGNSSWKTRLDVVKRLDGNLSPDSINTHLRFYDPFNKKYIDGDEYSAMTD